MDALRVVADAYMGKDRAAFLRKSRHVEYRDALAVDVRRHADQCADGDHTGAADARDKDSVGLGGRRKSRRWRYAE